MKQVLVLAAFAAVAAMGGAAMLQKAGAADAGGAQPAGEARSMKDAALAAAALQVREAARFLPQGRPDAERREALRGTAGAALAAFIQPGRVCDPAARAAFLQAVGPYLIARLHDQGGLAAEAHDPRWSTAEDAALTGGVSSLMDRHYLTSADLEGVIADDAFGRVMLATHGARHAADEPRAACRSPAI